MAEGFGDAPLSCRYGGGILKVRLRLKVGALSIGITLVSSRLISWF